MDQPEIVRGITRVCGSFTVEAVQPAEISLDDLLVRVASSDGMRQLTLVLEVKGYQGNQETAKHDGARRWVRAVNNWGKLGQWAFHVCRNPQMLDRELAYIVRNWRDGGSALLLDAAVNEMDQDLRDDFTGDTAVHGPRAYNELDEVVLSRSVDVGDLGKELPAGARGTVVGVWQGGRAYEVEFAEPFACLVTVPAEGLAA